MRKAALFALMSSFLALVHAAHASDSQYARCTDTTIWEASDAESASLLKIERLKIERARLISDSSDRNSPAYKFEYNKSKTAYFIEPGKKYSEIIVIIQGAKPALRMTVPDWKHRPLSARWLNDRVLAVETSFNPHSGIRWEYDVESQKVLSSKIGHDDPDAVKRCQNEK